MAINIMPTNIVTPTIPMHAAPHHYGRETSAYIDLVAVAIFIASIYLILVMTTG